MEDMEMLQTLLKKNPGNHKKNTRVFLHYGLLGLVVIAGIFLDQWTKRLAVIHLKESHTRTIVVLNKILQLTYVENRGAAWGLFQGKHMFFFAVGILLLILILAVYGKIPFQKRYIPMRMIAALLLMGAVGNMIDRALQGYVVDFFEFSFIDFPVFNVADIYVTVGAVLLILFGLFYYNDEDFKVFERKKYGTRKETKNES